MAIVPIVYILFASLRILLSSNINIVAIAIIVIERNEQYKNEVGGTTEMIIESAYVFLLMGVTLAAMFVPNLIERRK